MTIRYITSPARGNGSGDSWANGALFQATVGISSLLAASNPGDEIHIEGGKTHIGTSVGLTSTRLAGTPTRVRIRGVNEADGVPAKATLAHTLRPEPWVTAGAQGNRFLRLEAGARFLHFSDLIFHRHNEAVQFRHADNTGFLFEDCEFDNVSVAFSQATSLCPALTDSIFRRIVSRGHTGGFAGIGGDSHGLTYEDIDDDAEYQDDGQVGKGSNGFILSGTAHDITFLRANMRNGGREEGTNYWNGDGFTDATTNYDITYEFCKASGWLDGGWDIKSPGSVLSDCESSDNKRNYRFHGAETFELHRCKSLFPNRRGGSGTQDHFQLENTAAVPAGTNANVHDATVDDDDPATQVSAHEGGPTLLTFNGGTIRKDPASPISVPDGRVVLNGTTVTNIGEEPPPPPPGPTAEETIEVIREAIAAYDAP